MKLAWLLLLAIPAGAQTFAERANTAIDAYAKSKPGAPLGYANIAAKLKLRQDAALCSRELERLLGEGPTGDMFWMFPVTAIAYLDQGQLTDSARNALHRAWRDYMPYRGDTENHWLLYYSTLYLMAQLWPDQQWFNGKTSAENLREAAGWIESWVRLTTRRGQGEYDSPHYIGVFLLPMSYLAEWARDPAMRTRARMMLDYLIADYAAENLDGIHVGAESRVYERQVLEKSLNTSSAFGWTLFGLGRPPAAPDVYTMYYAVASNYEPPEIIRAIATDRSRPYVHSERKRTRNRWRFFDDVHGPVYKTTYVRAEYAVGSDQGGTLQPIQEHSWDVTWRVPDARGVENTFFTMHPYSSLRELQTYFTFPPDLGISTVVSSKKAYDSPDKFVGGSPYEQIFQDRDTVIALYDIPSDTRFPHINGFFSKHLAETREDSSSWIFARGGDAWIAARFFQPYVWKPLEGGSRRLFSPHRQNGVVVQMAARSEYPDLESFRRAILALPLEIRTSPTPSARFTSLRGRRMEFTYGQTPRVDGTPLNYDAWPLFGGPFLEAPLDSERLTIKHGNARRELDFKTLTVHERP